jgi:pimeloyl-ACP methyl ester carboxylesterase
MARLLHVRRSGRGPAIVLLHGLAGSGLFWEPIVPILSKKFEVVRLDLLGYGHSPKPMIKYTVQEHISAIYETLLSEGITKPFAVVGLSMGALLWLNYALQYPGISRIIGIGLPYYDDKMQARELILQDRWARLVMKHQVLGEAWLSFLWWIGRHNRVMRKRVAPSFYSDDMTKESLMNPPRVLRSSIVHCMLNNLAPKLLRQNTDKTILLIHGADDQWSPVEPIREMAASYPNIQLSIMEGVAHNTALIAPKKTAAHIMAFLAAD